MAEPTTSTGLGLTIISVSLLGSVAGPYALIVLSALAGALWPLLADKTETKPDGAWLLLRCTLTAVVLTVFIAQVIDRLWAIPANELLGPVALAIGALGNGWQAVFGAAGSALQALVARLGGSRNDA